MKMCLLILSRKYSMTGVEQQSLSYNKHAMVAVYKWGQKCIRLLHTGSAHSLRLRSLRTQNIFLPAL